MTLQQWQGAYPAPVRTVPATRHTTEAVGVLCLQGDPGYALLWQLSDYEVTTAGPAVTWLAPRVGAAV